MKNNTIFALLVILSLAMPMLSCERAAELSETDILSVDWKVSHVLIDGVKDESKDYSSYIFSFKRDLTFSFTNAPVSKVGKDGTWILSDDNQFLYLTDENGTETEVPIITLDENNAELLFTIPATFKSPAKDCVFALSRN